MHAIFYHHSMPVGISSSQDSISYISHLMETLQPSPDVPETSWVIEHTKDRLYQVSLPLGGMRTK
jgi:hypothetical protein